MNRRLPHILCSLWLVATSLAPGQGWSLCFEASGTVAVEMNARAKDPAEATAARADCATECPPERCHDCRDVSLDVADRACPRRAASEMGPLVEPIQVVRLCEPFHAELREALNALEMPAFASPHLIRVLRC